MHNVFAMIDAYGREIHDLRLSVTDRWNLRCRFGMPVDGTPLLPHGEILRYEELFPVARALEMSRVGG